MRFATIRPRAAVTVLSVFIAVLSAVLPASATAAEKGSVSTDPTVHQVHESMLPRLCFDASVSVEEMDQARLESLAAIEAGDTDLPSILEVQNYNLGSSWNAGDGSPVEVTWSLVPDGTKISDLSGSLSLRSDMFARMDAQFADLGGRQVWVGEIERAFDRWSELTGMTFRRVSMSNREWDDGAAQSFSMSDGSSTRGQIRIGMAPIDGSGGYVGWNYLPSGGGDMTLDSTENWLRWSNLLTFRNSFMHELGHGLGLNHVCSSTHGFLMEPRILNSYDGPQHDDIRALHYKYGDAAEPNGSPSLAVGIGSLSSGGALSIGVPPPPSTGGGSALSLRDASDEDWFSVSLGVTENLNIAVSPLGFLYDDGDQSSSGGCNGGPDIDSSRAVDLSIALYKAAAKPQLIASVDRSGPGLAETLSGISITTSGEYLIRISAGRDNGSGPQLYTLDLAAPASAFCAADLTTSGATLSGESGYRDPDGIVDLDDLAVFLDRWLVQDPTVCDLTTTGNSILTAPLAGEPDGLVDLDDLGYYLEIWGNGCG